MVDPMATATNVKPLSVREVQQVAAFRVALRTFARRAEVVARSSGLTPQWYLLLLLIKGADSGDEQATVGELAERMQLAQSTVTELVDRVARAGLVTRTISPNDGRVAYVALTAEGEERFKSSFRGLADERIALRDAIARLSG
jgi:DNA-binding MarR family transcriptional regulator